MSDINKIVEDCYRKIKHELVNDSNQEISWDNLAKTHGYKNGEYLRSWFKQYRKAKGELSTPIKKEDPKQSNELEQVQLEKLKIRDEKNQLGKLLKYKSRTDLMCEYIEGAIKKLSVLEKVQIPNIKINDKEELIVLYSDSQVGEAVYPYEIDNLNEYNIEIFKQRTLKYFATVKEIAYKHNVSKIHIYILGDLLEGIGIYANQNSYLCEEVVDALLITAEFISEILFNLSKEFFIDVETLIANHGKVSYESSRESTNYEYLLYKFIYERIKNVNNIKFAFNKSFLKVVQVMGHNYLLVHGDKFSNKGTASLKVSSFYDQAIDLVVMGHWHVPESKDADNLEYIVNGSVVGCNLHSIKKFHSATKASQTCFTVTEDSAKWATYKVVLN